MVSDRRFHLQAGGLRAEVMEYGARLVCCHVPDAAGVTADVVPGLDSAEDYRQRGGTMGAIVGRYANRISGGRVMLDGVEHVLERNDGAHVMHGGAGNFSTLDWQGEQLADNALRLRLTSPDGDQGWPGQVEASVDYRLDAANVLEIEMRAVSDRTTWLNMLFHGYWNLGGHGSGSVLDHQLQIAADHYLPKTEKGLPTGEILLVEDTPFDFRQPRTLGAERARLPAFYGHNLCLSGHRHGVLAPAATLTDPVSGRSLTLQTDQPGLQLYTANQWKGIAGKEGAVYGPQDAVALESQLYPNSPNMPTFNPAPLLAGQPYRHRMRIAFSAQAPAPR